MDSFKKQSQKIILKINNILDMWYGQLKFPGCFAHTYFV